MIKINNKHTLIITVLNIKKMMIILNNKMKMSMKMKQKVLLANKMMIMKIILKK